MFKVKKSEKREKEKEKDKKVSRKKKDEIKYIWLKYCILFLIYYF